jgi:succinoglycan biosynthesis transport protein ExoP
LQDDPDLGRYLGVIRRGWAVVLLTAAAFAAGAVAVSFLQSPQYKATATLLYSPGGAAPQIPNATDEARVISTLVSLATTQTVLVPAAARLHVPYSTLQHGISVSGATDSNIIELSATAGSAADAQREANVTAATFVAVTSRDHRATANGDLTIVQAATRPSSPTSPRPLRDGIAAALAGLLVGIVIVIVRDRLNRRLRSVEQVEQAYELPTLGEIPHANGRGVLADFAGGAPLAEAYRVVRTNLSLFEGSGARDLHSVVISSAVAGEGKSAVAANLAMAAAAGGRRVLAVSADLKAPALHRYLMQDSRRGLVDVLAGGCTLDDAATPVPLTGALREGGGSLSLLAGEQRFSDPAALFSSPAMERLLREARDAYDLVVIDAPAVLGSGETPILARRADVLILVGRVGVLTRDDARRASSQLAAADIRPLGIVVNDVPEDDAARAASS